MLVALLIALAALSLLLAPASAQALEPTPTDNAWGHEYVNAMRWDEVTSSYLFVLPDGSLERVEYGDAGLVVEGIGDFQGTLTSQTVIPAWTYTPTGAGDDGVMWGGACLGESGHYVVTGQENYSESNDVATFRVARYDLDWNFLGSREVLGANTIVPFANGRCELLESDGRLYVRTCHKMYGNGGTNHQASLLLVLDSQTLDVVLDGTRVFNISQSTWGYVSHSFSQYVTALDGIVYLVDHGDAHPRSVSVKRYGGTGSTSYLDVIPIQGDTGANDTGVMLGGARASEAAGTLLVVGNMADQEAYEAAGSSYLDKNKLARNVWLSVVDPSLSGNETIMLTDYETDGDASVTNPYLVKLEEDRFLVLWGVMGTNTSSFCMPWASTGELNYVFVDGNGRRLGEAFSAQGILSSVTPVVWDGKVMWYASGGSSGAPSWYAIDGSTGELSRVIDVSSAKMSYEYENRRYYDSDTGTWCPGIRYHEFLRGFGITVTFGDKALEEGVDYRLAKESDLDAGVARYHATGLGDCTGEVVLEVPMAATPLSTAYVDFSTIPTQYYTGEALTPQVVLRCGDYELVEGTDYELSYVDNVGPTSSTGRRGGVVATGVGWFKGSATAYFTIQRSSLAGAVVSAPDCPYDGTAQRPEVSVALDGRELVQGTDFTVATSAYRNNVNVGTATVTVTGINGYTGSAAGTFVIVPADLSGATIDEIADQEWQGEAVVPGVTVRMGTRTLTAGRDYLLAWSDNDMPGTATVVAEGMGSYTGSVARAFTVAEPFKDVIPKTAHYEDILWLYSTGITKGWGEYPSRTYRPLANVARCDMAAFLYRLAGSPDYEPTADEMAYFSDVTWDTPHAREVWWLASQGVTRGWDMPDGTHQFRPYANVARCDMAAFLMRMALGPDAEAEYAVDPGWESYFGDIDASSPHRAAVLWLAEQGVSQGWVVGWRHEFRSLSDVARADMAAFLHRMYSNGLVQMER